MQDQTGIKKPETQQQSERGFIAYFGEYVNNTNPIDWNYWLQQMPRLSAAEAARLMCALDPDEFENLKADPNPKGNSTEGPRQKARNIERIAVSEDMKSATPREWAEWAIERSIHVHDVFTLALGSVDEGKPQANQPSQNSQPDPLPTQDIAVLFAGVRFTRERWIKNIGHAKWLAPANRTKGQQGGAPATWCPLELAQLICDKEKDTRAKQKTLKSLNSRFRKNPALKPWVDAWNDYYEQFKDTDEA